jgi:hypothetical protein
VPENKVVSLDERAEDDRRCQRIKVSKRDWIRAAILSMGATNGWSSWNDHLQRSFIGIFRIM